jgi:hypothetical protein
MSAFFKSWREPQVLALLVALLGLALLAIGALLDPPGFLRAYFTGVMIAFQHPLGCLALLIAHQLLGGRWGLVIGGALTAGVRTLPMLAILFLPILLDPATIYPWLRPDHVAAHQSVAAKTGWLNAPFFAARSLLYLLIWAGIALLLTAEKPAPRALSVIGAIVLPITVSFAAIDWMMSLEPDFVSTVYGLVIMSGQAVGAIALALVATFGLAERKSGAAVLRNAPMVGLGSLLLGLVMLWAYHAFMQLLVAWSGNLPHQAAWYLARGEGVWLWAVWLIAIGHVALPILLLLSARIRQSAEAIMALAWLILAMRLVDWLWTILPGFEAPPPAWMVGGALLALPGLAAVSFLYQLHCRAERIVQNVEASHD